MLATIIFLAFFSFNSDLVFGLNFTKSCGRSHFKSGGKSPQTQILGGTNANPGEFPWQVINKNHNQFICGGTIISSRWIMTAAHCVMQSKSPSEYSVSLGVHNIHDEEDNKKVARIVRHERHNPHNLHNDIALVQIDYTIDFNGADSHLQPICLATSSMKSHYNCIATGFGWTNAWGELPTILQKVSEAVIDSSHCEEIYGIFDSAVNICAGGTELGGTGTCSGDSGGPLQCKESDGKYYQVGITSYGIYCALANTPDVFAKVSTYVDWFKNVVSKN